MPVVSRLPADRLPAAALAGAHPPARPRAAAPRPRPGALARRPRGARGRAGRRHPDGRGRGGGDRVPPGADAVAVLRRHRGRARRRRGQSPRTWSPGRRCPSRAAPPPSRASTSTPRCMSAPTGERWPGLQHRDRGGARRHARLAHPQAAHPGHRGLLRGPLLPPRPGRRRRVPADRAAHGKRSRPPSPARGAHVLGSVVPGAGARLLAGGRRGPHLPDGDRLRA